jgi:hypothetical protein
MSRTVLRAVLAVVTGALLASPASAAVVNGYVCRAAYVPFALASSGTAGYVLVDVYTQPACAGRPALTASGILKSRGATEGDTRYLFSEAGLLAVHHDLVEAALAGRQVTLSKSDTTSQVFWVNFYAQP